MKRSVVVVALAYLAAVSGITIAAYGEIVNRASQNQLAYTCHNKNVYLSDFVQFYTAGKLVSSGQGQLIYDAEAISKNMPVPLAQDTRIFVLFMPFFISFVAPITLLSLHASFIFWILLSLASLTAASILILKGRRHFGAQMVATIVFCILASQPAWFTLFTGHACFFQYLFIAVFFWALFSKKDLPAALALALTSFKPQFALPLLVPALAQRRFKLLALAGAFELFLIILSILTLGPQTTFSGPLSVLQWEHGQTDVIPRMISLRAVLDTVVPHNATAALTWTLFALWLAFTYRVWRRADDAELTSAAAAITISGALLFSPHAHLYDAVLMGLAACFVWPRHGFGDFHRSSGFLRLCLWSLLAAYPLVSWYFFTSIGTGPNVLGYPFAGWDMAILVVMLLLFKKQTSASAHEASLPLLLPLNANRPILIPARASVHGRLQRRPR